MAKFCTKCGAELKENTKFCINCGAKITQAPSLETQAENVPIQQSQPVTTPTYQRAVPKKPNKNLIIGIIAVVLIAVVVIVLLLVFTQGGGIFGGGEESKFYGSWEMSSSYLTVEWKFNSDKTFEIGSYGSTVPVGTWKLSNGKLVLTYSTGGYSQYDGTYGYTFSDNGNTLTLDASGYTAYTLTKK